MIIYRNIVEFPEPSSNYIITLMAFNAAGEGPPAYDSAITREEQGMIHCHHHGYLNYYCHRHHQNHQHCRLHRYHHHKKPHLFYWCTHKFSLRAFRANHSTCWFESHRALLLDHPPHVDRHWTREESTSQRQPLLYDQVSVTRNDILKHVRCFFMTAVDLNLESLNEIINLYVR